MSQITAASAKIPLHFLLIGKTGHGKSATGNSILGRKEFAAAASTKSKTKKVQVAWEVHKPYDIKVVDGPGLEDTDLDLAKDKEVACTNMAEAMIKCNQGVHAFVLVISFPTRFTQEEKNALSALKTIFGENYLKEHGIIVFTGGDQFPSLMEQEGTTDKSFREWCMEQDEELFKECSPRIVLFNNVTKSKEEKEKQRNELFKHAEILSQEKGLYTNEHFHMYAALRQEMIKRHNLPLLDESVQRKINLLAAEIKRISENSSLVVLEHLQTHVHVRLQELLQDNENAKSWQQLIQHLKEIQNITEQLERAIKEKDIKNIQFYVEELQKHGENVKLSPWETFVSVFKEGIRKFLQLGRRFLELISFLKKSSTPQPGKNVTSEN